MPIAVVVPTIVRFSMQHTQGNGRPADVIFDLSLDESGVTRHDAVNELVPVFVGMYQDDICGTFWSSLHFTGSRWLDLDSLGGTGGFQAPISGKPTTGGSSGAMGAPMAAVLVHKHCLHTRSQRDGRSFIPALAEVDYDDVGTLSSTVRTAWQNRLDTFKGHINALESSGLGSVAWRVVHVEGHTEPSPGHPAGQPNEWSSSDIISLSIDPKIATQRRRNRG